MTDKRTLVPAGSRRGGRRLTAADFWKLPDDGRRYEVLDGELLVTPAPVTDHQRVSAALFLELALWAQRNPPAEVFAAPVGLQLAGDTILQPDLLVVRDPAQVRHRAVAGAPALVVEVLSPSTQGRDRGRKRERYAQAGVPEYWLADPRRRRIEQYLLREGRLELRRELTEQNTLAAEALPGFAVPVALAFRSLRR